jgi:hypothetical protein
MKGKTTCCHSALDAESSLSLFLDSRLCGNDMKRLFIIIVYTVILLASFASQAFAHRLQPAYLEINEQTTGKFNILWKRPLVGNRPMNIYPHLPETCSNITEPSINPSQSFALERWLIDCGKNGLANETIVIDGLEKTVTDTLVRIYYLEGAEETHLLRPATPSATVCRSRATTMKISDPAIQKRFVGQWVRPDGGYVIHVREIKPDGSVDVGYFNPKSINVSESKVSVWKGFNRLFLKLDDKGYPGSTYTLYYYAEKDQLVGFYHQAEINETFEVLFVRKR